MRDPLPTGETTAHDGEGGLGLLVHQVRSGELDREGFLRAALKAGVTEERAAILADEALPACENQLFPTSSSNRSHDRTDAGRNRNG